MRPVLVDPDDENTGIASAEVSVGVVTDGLPQLLRAGVLQGILFALDHRTEMTPAVPGPVPRGCADGTRSAGTAIPMDDLEDTEMPAAPAVVPGIVKLAFDRG